MTPMHSPLADCDHPGAGQRVRDLAEPEQWCLYLLECAGGRLYCGITNRLTARLAAHRNGRGAKFTRAFAPQTLVAALPYPNRSEASKAEWALKQMPRARKLAFAAEAGARAVASSATTGPAATS